MRRPLALGLCLAVVLGAALPQSAAISYAAENEGEPVAFLILEDLAAEAKTARTRSGYAQIAAGALTGIVVAVVLHPIVPDHALAAGVVVGALGAIPGVITLTQPTASELAMTRVLTFPQAQRERQSVLALHQLAEGARERRIVRAIGYGAAGLAGFAAAPLLATETTYYWGFYNLGMAAYSLFFPSREERALTLYQSLTQVEGTR